MSSSSPSDPSSSISSSSIIPFIVSSIGRFLSSDASVDSLKTTSNLLSVRSGIKCFFAFGHGGGGKIGSTAILKHFKLIFYLRAFSIIVGITLAK